MANEWPEDAPVTGGAWPQDQPVGQPTGVTMTGRIGGPAASMVAVRNMMRLLSPRFGGAQPQQQGDGPPVETSSALGGGGQEMRSSSRGPPESVDTSYAGSAPNWISAAASLAVRPEDELALYRQYSPNPNWRWGRMGGNVVYADEAGRVHRAVAPVMDPIYDRGLSGVPEAAMRAGQWAGSGAGPAAPQIVGGAAALVPNGPGGQAVAASGAAAVTDFVRQQIVNAMLRRSPMNVDVGNIAGQSALAGGSQLVGSGVASALERMTGGNAFRLSGMADRAAITNPANLTQWRDLAQNASTLGVPLRPDQITGLSSMQQTARQLMREPGSTNTMQAFQRNQQGQAVPGALAQEIPAVTPTATPGATEAAAGAQRSLDTVMQGIQAQGSPHFQAAFQSGVMPDRSRVLTLLQSELDNTAPGTAAYDALRGVQESIRASRNFQSLHTAKEAIDTTLQNLTQNAAGSEARRAAHALQTVQNELVSTMESAHPEYQAGMDIYRQLMPGHERISRGIVGMQARTANATSDVGTREQLSAVLSRGNQQEIAQARAVFERTGNLDAWNAGVRDWLEGAANTARRVRVEGNLPGNVAGRFGVETGATPVDAAATSEMLGGAASPEAARFRTLSDVLNAASRSIQEGSPTVTDLMGRGRLVGGPTNLATNIPTMASPTSLINRMREWSIARNAPRIAATYTPSDALSAMAAIENPGVLSPRSYLAARVAGQSVPELTNAYIQAWQRAYLPNVGVGAQ